MITFLALPVANWSASSDNKTTTSIRVSWQNLASLLDQKILHYIAVVTSTNGSIENGNIVPENTTYDVFYGLTPYTEYRLIVVGVNDIRKTYKSTEATAWTDEAGTFLIVPYFVAWSRYRLICR